MNYKIDFVKNRKIYFSISLIITLIGVITLLVFHLNYGVDFKSGTTLDITTETTVTKQQALDLFQKVGLDHPSITEGGNKDRVTARFDRVLNQEEVTSVIKEFKAQFGEGVSYEENTVDAGMARELGLKAMKAVLYASLGIIIYVAIRFEWRFAIAGILALLHDAFIVVSLFSIFRLEVNLPFIAAILTIIGYSINDTIVIFDRIRENLAFTKLKTFEDLSNLVNKSIWQTMTRSINTSVTVLFAALCLFIFGSESIRLFSLAMIFGLVSGVYSSVFIASPIWVVLKKKNLNSAKKVSAAK